MTSTHAVHIKGNGFVSTRIGSQTLSNPTTRMNLTAEQVIEKHMKILKAQHGPNITSETL